MRARSELRSSRRSTLLVVVLIGLVGGLTLAAAAGARRTETAYPRFLVATNSEDYLVSAANTGTALYADVARLPEVAQTGVVDGLPFFYRPRPGKIEPGVQVVASRDGRAGYVVEKL